MAKKLVKSKVTYSTLKKLGVPAVLIAGIIFAHNFGWDGKILNKYNNYYSNKNIFPISAIVKSVEDGDTFTLNQGIKVRLIGVDAPARGEKNYLEAKYELEKLLKNKKVFLEYDRYQDDKYGRILAWIWINCEEVPEFKTPDYMKKSASESMPGLIKNPDGWLKGKLIQEELLKKDIVKTVNYSDRGELKYQKRISDIFPQQ